jgi:hypothetical protein
LTAAIRPALPHGREERRVPSVSVDSVVIGDRPGSRVEMGRGAVEAARRGGK